MSSVRRGFVILTDEPDKYSRLGELLAQQGWTLNRVDLGANLGDQLANVQANNTIICLALLSPNTHKFSQSDIRLIRKLTDAGNSLIIAAGDEETAANAATNLNQLSSNYGVKFRKNCVIRPNPYKQYHPKEVMLTDFMVNRSFNELIKKHCNSSIDSAEFPSIGNSTSSDAAPIRVLYANGCSLQVDNDSHVILTSSNYSIPPNQAICTLYKGLNNSKVIVLGSASVMSDAYVDEENNGPLVMALLDICQDEHFSTNLSDARTLELPEMVYTGDMKTLIDLPLPCFETLEPLPRNKTDLIARHVFNFDCSKLPLVVDAYSRLGLVNEPLTLLRPRFHCQYLKLEPATHGFVLRRSKGTQ